MVFVRRIRTIGAVAFNMGKCFVNVLFPRRCPVCGEIVEPEGEWICTSCLPKLAPVRQPVCKKCGKEVIGEGTEYCPDCERHKRTFDSGAALLNYNEAARRSMAAIKYKNKREYLDFYSMAMAHRFRRQVEVWKPDVLVPVPVHPSRRRQRGYNQAEELAKRLGRKWEIPVDTELLIRSRKTAPQRDLNPRERLKNLQEAFGIHPHRLSARRKASGTFRDMPRCVVLIDDIYTTGSTVEACSRVLRAAGVKEIHYLAICIGHGR